MSLTRDDIIGIIAENSINKTLGLFVGAGMTKEVIKGDPNQVALGWLDLLKQCCENFDIEFDKSKIDPGTSSPLIASMIVTEISIKKSITHEDATTLLKEYICEITAYYPNKTKRESFSNELKIINPIWIITTNYDLVLECLFPERGISKSSNDILNSVQDLIPIYHIHGIRTVPSTIIITQEDYISLFRPNEYRTIKLSILLKEATTVFIGYGLADINVLTSIDWSLNFYKEPKSEYHLIQLLWKKDAKSEPYNINGVWVLEYVELVDLFKDINSEIEIMRRVTSSDMHAIELVKSNYSNLTDEKIDDFISEHNTRKSYIYALSKYPGGIKTISGFIELLSKSLDKIWSRSSSRNEFWHYKDILEILLDVIMAYEKEVPPILLEVLAYQLNKVGSFIGDTPGNSFQATNLWREKINEINDDVLKELQNIANLQKYFGIKRILNLR